jgi:predicted metalloendopeptidase
MRGLLRMFFRVLSILTIDACGGWEKRVEIPSDRGRYGTIDEASEANDRILRNIFSGEYPSNPPKNNLPDPKQAVDQQNFEKLQDAYQACLNETTINEIGATPLLAILENIIAKYPVESACHPMKFQASPDESLPVVDTDKEHCSDSKDSLTDVIEYLQSIGVGALFSLAVTVRTQPRLAYIAGRLQKYKCQHNVCLSKWFRITEQESLH